MTHFTELKAGERRSVTNMNNNPLLNSLGYLMHFPKTRASLALRTPVNISVSQLFNNRMIQLIQWNVAIKSHLKPIFSSFKNKVYYDTN